VGGTGLLHGECCFVDEVELIIAGRSISATAIRKT